MTTEQYFSEYREAYDDDSDNVRGEPSRAARYDRLDKWADTIIDATGILSISDANTRKVIAVADAEKECLASALDQTLAAWAHDAYESDAEFSAAERIISALLSETKALRDALSLMDDEVLAHASRALTAVESMHKAEDALAVRDAMLEDVQASLDRANATIEWLNQMHQDWCVPDHARAVAAEMEIERPLGYTEPPC